MMTIMVPDLIEPTDEIRQLCVGALLQPTFAPRLESDPFRPFGSRAGDQRLQYC
jgi:hypothetical protein